MADSSINPYTEILQFDPKDCPPDHYALLGLPRYASDPQQVEAATAEQVRYVRPFCARYPTEGTLLLNELTKAKLCLLDDDDRAAYDATLRQSENRMGVERTAGTLFGGSRSFADEFGEELDAAGVATADERHRRCPHCGSGVVDDDKFCQSCTGGLAHRAAWKSAKCPECRKPLRCGAVVCKSCHEDLSMSDVAGCVPPHVPGTIKPFECRNRKQLRADRRRALKVWRKNSQPNAPKVGGKRKSSPKTAPPKSGRSFRKVISYSLVATLSLLGLYGILQLLGPASDRSEAEQQVADVQEDAAKFPMPEIESAEEPIEAKEGELLKYRPEIANLDRMTDGLVFHLASGELPQGCRLDESTGELQWTPTETQGPGRYRFDFSCHPANQPADATQYMVELNVVETNSPPRLDVPLEATLPAGSTLEQSIGLVDEDFPANRITLELKSGPKGAVVDEIGKLLYWEIPADWQEPRVEFTVAARDDGMPPLSTTHTLVVTITDMMAPQPVEPAAPESQDRIPEVAVDLPRLPRPGEPIEPVALDFALDSPVTADDARLSLMLPHDLRGLLKMRYIDDDDSRLAIMLTNPFKADDVPGNLSDGIAATCVLKGSKYIWTWAMTKDLTARGYQNNIRHGVLTIESKSGGTPRLVALQKVIEVPAPTLNDMLADEKMQSHLIRWDRVKKSIALEGLQCTANNGNWQVGLESQIEGFSLFLVSPDLTQRVNAGARSGGMQFTEFGFRVLPHTTEITIGLDAKPSPVDAYQQLRGARKSLNRKQTKARSWQRKLSTARGLLSNAQKMSTKSPAQRRAKSTKINQATRAINQAETSLAKLAIEIPADQNLIVTLEKTWNAIVAQLEPIRNCVIAGELWRRIGDVRVPVLRLVPVELAIPDA